MTQAENQRLRYLTFAILAGLTLFRLWYIGSIPLSEDEANSWQWSRHLSFGYYDQGPMIAWVVRLGTLVFGHTEFGVRVTAPFMMLGLSLLFWDFCRRVLKNEWLGLWLALASNATLLFSAGAVIQTYDTAQAFFWLLSLYLVGLALFDGRPRAWYPAGVALGLAMLAKYHSVLLPVMILAFLAATPSQRHWLKRREPWLAALIAALVFCPNLYWNHIHHWTAFGLTLGKVKQGWNPTFFEFLGGQAGLIGPVFFVLIVIGWARAWKMAKAGDARAAFLLWCSLPMMLLFALLSFKNRVQANWPAPLYLAGLLAGAWGLLEYIRSRRAWRRWALAGLITGLAFAAMAYCHVPLIRALNLPGDADPTAKLYGWPEMGRAIGRELAKWPGKEKPFIFGDRYQTSSLAAFYTPGQPQTEGLFAPSRRLNVYLFWTDPAKLKGRDGLGVIMGNPKLSFFCTKVSRLRHLELKGPTGKVLHRVDLVRCHNFKGFDARPAKFLPLAGKW